MDLFDRQILVVLRDGKPRKFEELLQEIRFSHNTLRLHLSRLEREGFIVKAKKLKNGLGRPTPTYSLPPKLRRQVDVTVTEPYTTIVSLTFQKLRHLCRFEKGRYCKKTRRRYEAQNCPQILKGRINTIFNYLFNSPARAFLGSHNQLQEPSHPSWSQ